MAKDVHETLRVLVTCVDGRIDHPFRAVQAVGDVRTFAYDRLVQDKKQISFSATWMERADQRLQDETLLASLVPEGSKNPGNEIDLTLTLAWTTQGGRRIGS